MAKKYLKSDEIQIQILPPKRPNQLFHIEYVKNKKIIKYKKPVKLNPKSNFKVKPVIFYMSGFTHSINTKSKMKQFKLGIDAGTQFLIKHECKNKFDENACAIYFKKLKIGYIPKNHSSFFIDQAEKKKYFKFVSCFNPLLIDFDNLNQCSFPIIAIPTNLI